MIGPPTDPYNCDSEIADVNGCLEAMQAFIDVLVTWQDNASPTTLQQLHQAFVSAILAQDAGFSSVLAIMAGVSDLENMPDEPENDVPF